MGNILRIFGVLRFLKQLRVMVNSVFGLSDLSCATLLGFLVYLMWSVVIFGTILCVFALLFVQQLTSFQLKGGPETWESELCERQRFKRC